MKRRIMVQMSMVRIDIIHLEGKSGERGREEREVTCPGLEDS